SSNSRAVHFAPPAGGLLNAQGAQGRPLHTSPAKFLCIFLSCCYFETTRVQLLFWLFLWLYSHHAIPDSNMGLDILRRTRLFFQFLTQRSHKYAQGCNIVFPASSPNLLGDERMGQH